MCPFPQQSCRYPIIGNSTLWVTPALKRGMKRDMACLSLSVRRQLYTFCFRFRLNWFSGKLREGIVAAKRRDEFASDGLSVSVLVLYSLSHSDSLRDVSADLYPFFFCCQYRVNPLIPASNVLYRSIVGSFAGFDDFNRPVIAIGFLLPLSTRLLRISPKISLLRVHRTRFPNCFLASFSRQGDSIM